MKNLFMLEDSLFQAIEALYKAKEFNNLDSYDMALAAIEILNEDYAKENYGSPFLTDTKIIEYYRGRWEIK